VECELAELTLEPAVTLWLFGTLVKEGMIRDGVYVRSQRSVTLGRSEAVSGRLIRTESVHLIGGVQFMNLRSRNVRRKCFCC
jgi:hypothetical protein